MFIIHIILIAIAVALALLIVGIIAGHVVEHGSFVKSERERTRNHIRS